MVGGCICTCHSIAPPEASGIIENRSPIADGALDYARSVIDRMTLSWDDLETLRTFASSPRAAADYPRTVDAVTRVIAGQELP